VGFVDYFPARRFQAHNHIANEADGLILADLDSFASERFGHPVEVHHHHGSALQRKFRA
jgi:hypothetical protein